MLCRPYSGLNMKADSQEDTVRQWVKEPPPPPGSPGEGENSCLFRTTLQAAL